MMKTIFQLSVSLLLSATLTGCACWYKGPAPANTPIAGVHHVVLCWLKEPGKATDRQQLIEVSKSFTHIPGVISVHAGEVMPSDRAIVDDSFDVAIYLTFATEEDLQRYLDHPKHQEAKKDTLMPLVKKVVVYDFKTTL